MDYSFVIRKATIGDAESIYSIMQEAFKKYMLDTGLSGTIEALSESIDDIRNDIMAKDVFVAFIDETPVGSVRIMINDINCSAYLSRFGVSLDYHNIGIGKSLMNLVDKLLMSRNIHQVSLHTASKYSDLVRFYYGRGFYIDTITKDKGYIRALMVKEYL